MTDARWRSWHEAMTDALYGDHGLFRTAGAPGACFRTAANATTTFGAALRRLAERVDDALGHPGEFTLVDVGAGGGELLAQLAADAPPCWRLVGVDVGGRPPGLPRRVEWRGEPPDRVTGVVVALEWLDNVPVDVVVATEDGPRLVEVDRYGRERPGPPPAAADAAWLARWWPLDEHEQRAEVGRTRDEAWAGVVATLDRGVALAVDYVADPAAHPAGTLTGYRAGRQVAAVPDGRTDLTAHVLLASCAAAGEGAGATATTLATQREALHALGVDGRPPPESLATADPRGYLAALRRAGEAASLTDPAGWGGFGWLLQARRTRLPLCAGSATV